MYTDDDEEKYVYDIEVDGTDIHETYVFSQHKRADEVKEIWLEDVAEHNDFGERLAKVYRENVKVTDLWMKHNSAEQVEAEATQVPPQGLPGETVEEARERRLSSKTDTEQK